MLADSFWVMLLLLILSIVLAIRLKEQKSRFVVIFAIVFGFMGDIFLGLSAPWRTYAGGISFFIEHCIFIGLLIWSIKRENLKIFNIPFIIGIVIFVATLITMEVLAFTVVKEPNTLLAILTSFYILAISTHIALNFSYSSQKKGTYYLYALGILIFFATDVWVFLEILGITNFMSKYIWYFYQIGQLLLILFNNDLVFKPRNSAKID